MEMPPLYTTQHIVDRAIQLAEGWLKAERERIKECRMPSDYEPAAAELSSYLHTAIKDYARSHGESCARMAREEAAKLCDEAKATRVESAAQNNGRHSDFAFGYVSASEEIAAAIRKG